MGQHEREKFQPWAFSLLQSELHAGSIISEWTQNVDTIYLHCAGKTPVPPPLENSYEHVSQPWQLNEISMFAKVHDYNIISHIIDKRSAIPI